MIIGIDVREGVRTQRAGKGEFVYRLVTQLIQHTEHQFVLFSDAELPAEWQLPNVRARIWAMPSWLWQSLMIGLLNLRHSVDVYLATTSVIVPALTWRTPVVVVLFDFVSFLFSTRHNRKAVLFEKLWMRGALKRAQQLLAISESTKRDAVKLFAVDPDKIAVCYVGPAVSSSAEAVSLPTGSIVLFVGTLEPRKNVVNLVSAFDQLRAEGTMASLVLAGGWGWQSEEIKRALAGSSYAADIKVLGYVSEAQKTYLYQHATVLAFPSLYEGFGMPPLEAMMLGLPVVTSNVSSLPEVVDAAAVLVSPDSVTELTAALKRVITDAALRDQLKPAGLAQSKKFSWRVTSDVTLGALTSIRG